VPPFRCLHATAGGPGSIPGLPEAWGVLIFAGVVIADEAVTALKEVARMIASVISMNRLAGFILVAAGVMASSSPA